MCTMIKSSFEQANQSWCRSWCFSNFECSTLFYIYILCISVNFWLCMYIWLISLLTIVYFINPIFFLTPLPKNVLLISSCEVQYMKGEHFSKKIAAMYENAEYYYWVYIEENCKVWELRKWSLWYLVIMLQTEMFLSHGCPG